MIPSLQHHQVVGAAAPSLFSHRLSAMITPSAQLDPSPQRVDGFFFSPFLQGGEGERVHSYSCSCKKSKRLNL
uniref:Uncharacterized protein n=1 Tax=Oryza rufipogon TaxID=4529 RepID=A0A0E0PK77_ORYRU